MKRAKDNKASASTPDENEEKTYVVRVARDLSEYADVAVSTTDSSAAEEIVSDLLEGDKLDNLNYESGDDREGPYTCDSWEKEEDEQVDCTIENGTPVFTSELSRQSKSSSTKTSGPTRTCPNCGAELHASVKINLYAVEVNSDGRIINYDGGPQPASEEDILELCEPANTTIYCANNHPYSPQS